LPPTSFVENGLWLEVFDVPAGFTALRRDRCYVVHRPDWGPGRHRQHRPRSAGRWPTSSTSSPLWGHFCPLRDDFGTPVEPHPHWPLACKLL